MRGELKTAMKRVEDLQAAISGEIDSDNSDAVSVVKFSVVQYSVV